MEYQKIVNLLNDKPNQPSKFKTKNWTVCSCHVTYAFQSESTRSSCLNVKEVLARSKHEI